MFITKMLTVNIERPVLGNPPIIYNNIPIKTKWAQAGGKPKIINVINYQQYRIALCANAYVILCHDALCHNLLNCKVHKQDKQSYQFCRSVGCGKRSSYGYFYKKGLACASHKTDDMVDVMHKRCEYPGCTLIPSFGSGNEKRKYCLEHKSSEMIPAGKLCEHPGCQVRPSYGNNSGQGRFCLEHKADDMINVVSKRCTFSNCDTQPCFGLEGGNAQFCFEHKLPNMVDVVNRQCSYPGCITRPLFGDDIKMLFCKIHKSPNMIDLVSKRCEYMGCNIIPTFGFMETGIRFCKSHKTKEMLDLKHRKCNHPCCYIRPSFGYKKPIYCINHKRDDMVNVVSSICEHLGCNVIASYGYQDGDKLFCSNHMLPNMTNLKNKQCEQLSCFKLANFGHVKNKQKFCFSHKDYDMINVTRKRCSYGGCLLSPIYGLPKENNDFCSIHKSPNMINLVSKRCEYFDCMLQPSYCKLFSTTKSHCRDHSTLNEFSFNKRNPLCHYIKCGNGATFIDYNDQNIYPIRCFAHKFPTDIELLNRYCPSCEEEIFFPINKEICANCGMYREIKLHHFKESMVKYLLQTNGINFTHDKRISPNGSFYRPDFKITTKFGTLILEVDEYQHNRQDYNPAIEESRMIKIFEDIILDTPGTKVLFIRYNPDKYTGTQYTYERKRSYLCTLVKYFIECENINLNLGKIYLFYDGFNGTTNIEAIIPS